MARKRHKDRSCKDFLEDFLMLRESDVWSCLPTKTKKGILTLLDECRGIDIDKKLPG